MECPFEITMVYLGGVNFVIHTWHHILKQILLYKARSEKGSSKLVASEVFFQEKKEETNMEVGKGAIRNSLV